jgi:hypothetical protein
MSKSKKGTVPQGVGPTFEDLLRSISGIDAELVTHA